MSIVVLENYINGEFVASAATETLDLINPVDESVVGRTPVSTKEDVDAAVEAAQRAFETWGKTTPSVRQAALLKLADAIEAHSDEIVAAESANTGQAHQMIADEEVKVGADQMRFFAGAARLLEGKAAGEYMEGFTSYVRREPIGVVGQVTPWNYPFMMALWKIGPALAAGNTIVLKPSDTTPGSTLVLAKLSKGILPDGVFNVVLGNGGTGATLVENPALGLVSITGSVRAGIAVAVSAAQQLKRAHLELGGKAPAIVFGDVDIEKTATGIAEAAFFNGGQDCTAATRVIVHESIHDQLVEALVRNAEKLRPGAPSDPDAFYGPLNNINHFNAVSDKIANLPASAKIVTGGKRSGETGFFFEPTVITGVAQSDDIVQEETFGPILTVQSFSDEKEAITLANDVRFGLASSIWTKDHGVTQRVSAALDFGAVWINCHIPLVAEMPHGGFKYSGYGKDLLGLRSRGLHPSQARHEFARLSRRPPAVRLYQPPAVNKGAQQIPPIRKRATMRLIVGYLATPSGKDGLVLGAQLARSLGAQLDICMVLPPDRTLPAKVPSEAGYDDILAARAHDWLAEAKASVPEDIQVEVHLSFHESFAQGLLDEVDRLNALAIVVGASGDGLLGRHAIGSVSTELLTPPMSR